MAKMIRRRHRHSDCSGRPRCPDAGLGQMQLSHQSGFARKLMKCPSCGAETTAAHRFCGRCGGSFPQACAACGTLNELSAAFCGQCGRALARQGAERRHLTVMFCDMAGSTALAARLDPEDLWEVIRGFQDACVRGNRAIRRICREVHGRRRARLFWLSESS